MSMRPRLLSAPRGHTLIELVTVLVLLSILSVGASALLSGRADFSGAVVKDQLIASIRLAQQSAMSKTQGNNVSHTIGLSGNNFFFDISHPDYTSNRQVDGEGSTVTWSTTALTGSCSSVTGTLPHVLSFDTRGDATETRYCISGTREYSVCVSALGFAYEGVCDS
jgi:MSHA pilin protein MshC